MKFHGSTLLLSGALLLALLFPSPAPAETGYFTGTLIDIQKQVQRTPQVWLRDTVVAYSEIVSYELRFRVGNQIYVGEYLPLIQPVWPLPVEWKPGREVEMRLKNHSLFIRLSYGEEIETRVVRHTEAKLP